MHCNKWNDDWVALIYGEVDPAEELLIREHLDSCESCRETIRGLEASRSVLHQSAIPVPDAPRVVVLEPRRSRRPGLSFAGGLLAAAAVFALGLVTAPLLRGPNDAVASGDLEARLAQLESDSAEIKARQDDSVLSARNVVTRELLEDEIDDVLHRFEISRARDFEFLLSEITAAEYRTGRDLRNQGDVLLNTMLASNPGFREH